MREKALAALLLSAATAASAFDGRGALMPGLRLADATAPATPPSSAPSPQQLYDRLAPLLDIAGEPDPAARQALVDSLWWVLHTGTGQEAAAWFLQSGANARLRMLPTEAVVARHRGKAGLVGTRGYAEFGQERPIVALSKAFLEVPPEHRRRDMAAVLAHELFGHVTEAFRQRRAGFPIPAGNRYLGDELNARLLGWCVFIELNGPASDGNMFAYVRSPEGYARFLGLSASYATRLTAAEMTNPLGVARERLRALGGAEQEEQRELLNAVKWLLVIRHFVQDHGMDPQRFTELTDEFSHAAGHGHTMRRSDTEGAISQLRRFVRELESSSLRDILVGAAGSGYVRRLESQIALLGGRLGFYLGGRGVEREVDGTGQIRLDELKRMHEEDQRSNPEHRHPRYWEHR